MKRAFGFGLIVVALAGCAEAAPSETGPATKPVDEEAQTRRDALRTVRSHCLGRSRRLSNQRSRGRQIASRAEALRALSRLRSMAHHHQAADDVDNVAWRDLIAGAGDFLERTECLPGAIPRMDRELRFFETPEPEETYEEDVPRTTSRRIPEQLSCHRGRLPPAPAPEIGRAHV